MKIRAPLLDVLEALLGIRAEFSPGLTSSKSSCTSFCSSLCDEIHLFLVGNVASILC